MLDTDADAGVEYARQELPTWSIWEVGASGYVAHSPTYEHDGIVVQAASAQQLVERVRAVERVVALAMGRQGRRAPGRVFGETLGGAPPPAPPKPLTPRRRVNVARMQGFEGDPCQECGAMRMVRNGSCLKCVDCGGTSGCS